MMEPCITPDDIAAAARLLTGRVLRTPSIAAGALSAALGCDIVLKLENLQQTASFKPRGACVRLLALDAAQRRRGVVAASAGNHAQGVAYHARAMDIPATIYMPIGTPFTKVARTEALGARVVLTGAGLAEARTEAMAEVERAGTSFIHPYDDPQIIAGQGTVALEMLADHPDLEVLVVPIGGGGLIAGMAIGAKGIKPDIEIVGVQAAQYPSMLNALAGKAPGGAGATIAEGIAVKVPGALTRPVIAQLVSEVVLVGEIALERAVQTYIESQRLVVEGAGAAALAAVTENRGRFAGRKVGVVVSGGNIDERLLASVLMRGLVRDGRITRLRVAITDAPGALADVTRLVAAAGGNIVEVYHQRLFYDIPVKQADVDVVVETQDMAHVEHIIQALHGSGYPVRRLTDSAEMDDDD